MGHPNGERLKSEANDQIIDRRAEIAFQVLFLLVLHIYHPCFVEDGSGPGWSDHPGGVHDLLPGGHEDEPVLLLPGHDKEHVEEYC